MTNLILQLSFIFLWGSAFVAAKFGLIDAGPFSMLATRFIIVTLIFSLLVIIFKKSWPKKSEIPHLFLVGILLHGFYLGGVFYSISKGMPTGIAALIVTLQPVLTNVLSGPLLKEKVSFKQWIGVLLGFIGACLVLGFEIGNTLPIIGGYSKESIYYKSTDGKNRRMKKHMLLETLRIFP